MRILRIAHHGVVSAWRQRERELQKLGTELTLVSARRWNEGGQDVTLDPGDDEFVIGLRTFGRHPNAFLYSPAALWRLLGQSWDLIDLHEEPVSLAAAQVLALRRLRRVRTPFLLYSAQNIPKRYPVPFRWFERYALRTASGVSVCNAAAGEILRRKGLRAPVRLIGLGTSTGLFTPSSRNAPRQTLQVGYAGRLEPHKGVGVLLEAMAGVEDCRLAIAGEGPQRTELAAQAERLGIAERVTFHGHLGDQLPEFYRQLDVLVVPSLPTPGWLEQFGRVVVEAFASGVPVVASRSGALPEVVGEAGLLVPPGEPLALREALEQAADPQLWAQMRQAGLQRAQEFDWPAVAGAHRQLYLEALAWATDRRGSTTENTYDDAGDPPEIVVVAYGPTAPLAAALKPLTGFSITIVDNSSSAETRALAHQTGAHYIDPEANLGFAAGVNRGLEALTERGLGDRDVLLLNPDATVSPKSISLLQARLHQDPRLACVAPVQQHPETGAPQRVSWPFPSPAGAWLEAVGLGRLNRRCDFVIGSVLLLRGAALTDVGRFDERFFLYAEETDWQHRAVARGWSTGIVPEAEATHVGAGTGGDSVRRLEMFNTSLLMFMDKHHGSVGELSYRGAVLTGALLRSLLSRGARQEQAQWRLRFYTKAPRAGGVQKRSPESSPAWT